MLTDRSIRVYTLFMKLSAAQNAALKQLATSDSSGISRSTLRSLAAFGLVKLDSRMYSVTVRRGRNYITREECHCSATITDAGREVI